MTATDDDNRASRAPGIRFALLLALAGSLALLAGHGGSAQAAGWQRISPGGDCQCSDGSRFSFWLRQASVRNVVFYLEDGGACFDAKTCAPGSRLYQARVGAGPRAETGIFELGNPRNPFAGYSMVYVPYCSADVHLGGVIARYGSGLTIDHDGVANATTAMERMLEAFPSATNVVVIGESAGSIAAPLYAALIADRLPDARVVALADGSGSFPDDPKFDRLIASWGAAKSLPSWTRQSGGDGGRWSFPGLFIQSYRHDPRIVFARHDYAYDEGQAIWYPLVGVPAGNLLSRIDANEQRIEDADVDLLSYIAPGNDHTALSEDEFYTEVVRGEPLRRWVARLIAGNPVADVQCRGHEVPVPHQVQGRYALDAAAQRTKP